MINIYVPGKLTNTDYFLGMPYEYIFGHAVPDIMSQPICVFINNPDNMFNHVGVYWVKGIPLNETTTIHTANGFEYQTPKVYALSPNSDRILEDYKYVSFLYPGWMNNYDRYVDNVTREIDYLAKVSIQESNKVKVMYLSAMYFLEGVLQMDDEEGSRKIAKKIAGISDREANMLDILLDKVCREPGVKDPNPYENIKVFISALREVMHLDKKVITKDIIVEKWMMQFGPSTVFGLEYFPCFSAMMTDAYVGGYLNQQRTIEKVCGSDMVSYSKGVLNLITVIA